MKKAIVLVGLPGAGKTTVGRLVSQRLGAAFVDFDELIAARAGKSVARIFAEDGERVFRAMEQSVGREQLAAEPAVLSPGGGYLLDEQNRAMALQQALVVYLDTSPGVAASRLAGQEERPLLKGAEPVARLSELLVLRQSSYVKAHQRVTTDGLTAEQVAGLIAELARTIGGW